MRSKVRCLPEQYACRLAMFAARFDHCLDCIEISPVVELAENTERGGQVLWTDEQDIDPIDRGDFVQRTHDGLGLDLDDSKDSIIGPLEVPLEISAVASGPPARRQPADALRWVA